MRQIRMLRAMRRELETGLRRLLHGHAGGNPGHGQGAAYGLPRQFPTLPSTCYFWASYRDLFRSRFEAVGFRLFRCRKSITFGLVSRPHCVAMRFAF